MSINPLSYTIYPKRTLHTFLNLIIPVLLGLGMVEPIMALEMMRPHISIKPLPDGAQVTLDFTGVSHEDWSEMLAKPDRFHEAGYGMIGNGDGPALPIITELIPIVSSGHPEFTILESSQYSWLKTELKEAPAARLETDPPAEIRSYNYQHSPRISTPLIKLDEPKTLLGQSYLPLIISPLELDFDLQKLRVPEKVIINISGIIAGNPDRIDATGHIRSVITNDQLIEQLGHYLIITPPTFQPYLDHLVNWKKRKGHPVTIVSSVEAGGTPTNIKAFIQNAYDSWENPPEYILLIGDEDRGIGGFYVYNPDNEALVTDHPYVLLEGDDSFPEAWVGRLSVDTIVELAVVMNKIVSYESQPYMDDPTWFNRALMVCTVTAAISTQQTKNWVSRKLTENGYTQIDTVYYPMQTSIDLINNPINNGVGFVNYRGLGAWDHWIGPYYYNTHIDQLHNGFKLPILTNIVCGGGNFAASVDPVFGEKWLRAGTVTAPKGAVAFIGPSEVHTHTQFNNVVDIGLYSAIFDRDHLQIGSAMWEAKLELWRNYHESEYLPFGQSAEFYLNVYNLLGDPGMDMWTKTPQALIVEAPSEVNRSDDHLSFVVNDDGGNPISGAFVYIHNSENARGHYTDGSGQVTLGFNPGLDTSLSLTITGPNLHPMLESIPIVDASFPLTYSDWEINQNGMLQADSTHSMDLNLINSGGAITDLHLNLSVEGENCVLLDSQVVITSMDGNSSLDLSDIFSFQIDGRSSHGDIVTFSIEVSTATTSWTWQNSFPIQAIDLAIENFIILSGSPVAGDSLTFSLDITNSGGLAAPALSIQLIEQPLVWSNTAPLESPVIGIDATERTINSAGLILSNQIFPGEELDLSFEINYGNRTDTLNTHLQVESLNQFSPSLPDAYGYRMYDDLDLSFSLAPNYEWLEIDPNQGGSGSILPIYDNYEEDDEKTEVALPFPVSFYGQTYTSITVCSNGWIAMGSSPELSFYNSVIPSAIGPKAMIAPFWDDLLTSPGSVIYYEALDHIIIEWSQVTHLELQSTLNFQVIIYDIFAYPTFSGDNQIVMQFKDYYDFDTFANFSTTGIESPDYTTGIQASFNNHADMSVGSLHSGQALLFTTERAERFPASEITLNGTNLGFVLNPWSQASDSIGITNTGGSDLVYHIGVQDDVDPEPAPNPLANAIFTKGGPEPSGEQYSQTSRDFLDYEWSDQDDEGGPEFLWKDISQAENEVSYPGDPDDISIGPIALGFVFPMYDELYETFYFSSNGSMSFVSANYPWLNLPLPNGTAPPAIIAPWWDDLNNNDGVQGVPYFWSNGIDTAVVTWDNFPKFGTSDFHTFQVILVANGDIFFQYLEMNGIVTSSTVGIQNASRNKGIQVTYNSGNSIDDSSVIRIRRGSNWLAVNAWEGVVAVGETNYFSVDVDTRNMEAGDYSVPLTLSSNAVNASQIDLSINLSVIYGESPEGDMNGDYQVNIQDISALIEFVLLMEIPDEDQFTQADLSGDGILNIIDTILLSELILD